MSGLNESDVGAAVRGLVLNFLSKEIHTCQPGKVTAVNLDNTIDVKPMLRMANVDGSQVEYPVLPCVPVLFNAGTVLFVKLAIDDVVLLVFAEGSLEKWKTAGGVVNGSVNRRFSISDGFAIPLIYSAGAVIPQLLMTEAYKTSLEIYLGIINVAFSSLAAAVTLPNVIAVGTAFVTAYNTAFPGGFNPINGLTSKVKAA